METLETNVAKIHVGNSKQTNTYVATLAERTAHPDSELFAIVALPVLNPAALDDCERIASGILATFRRCYKRSNNESTFEVALGEINDEIGKLASLGQHTWTGKISACIAARQGNRLYAAATGKANALLMRGGEFNEITEATSAKHALKTFDTFSAGRIKVGDVVIITTAELFNYVSIDRIKNILSQNTLEIAAQEIVRVIEDTAGPEVAFGTLLLQETAPLLASEEGMSTSSYESESTSTKLLAGLSSKTRQVLSKETVQGVWQSVREATKKTPKLDVKKMSGMALSTGSAGLSRIKEQAKNYRNIDFKSPFATFKNFSRSKQFFTISVVVLLIAVIVNVLVAKGRQSDNTANIAFEQNRLAVAKLLSDADSKLVFKDEAGAASLVSDALAQLTALNPATDAQRQAKTELEQQAAELNKRVNKTITPTLTNIATLSSANNLLTLPKLLATATGQVVVSYNADSKATEDGSLRTSTDIVDGAYISGSNAVVFDGQGMNVWNFSKGTNGNSFFMNVPKSNHFVGMVVYPTNNRVYVVDTEVGQVTSYQISDATLSKPVVSVKDSALMDAQDLAVDGSVYVLTKTGINKYTAGKAAAFTFPQLTQAFSGTGRIFTNSITKQLYILDSNGRIIITDKTGKLIQILEHPDLKDATDFTVDEANKTIYVLRNGSLLQVIY
jgi:hypothetical protein